MVTTQKDCQVLLCLLDKRTIGVIGGLLAESRKAGRKASMEQKASSVKIIVLKKKTKVSLILTCASIYLYYSSTVIIILNQLPIFFVASTFLFISPRKVAVELVESRKDTESESELNMTRKKIGKDADSKSKAAKRRHHSEKKALVKTSNEVHRNTKKEA